MAPAAVMDGGHIDAPPHVELGDGNDSKENKLATLLKILTRYDSTDRPVEAEDMNKETDPIQVHRC